MTSFSSSSAVNGVGAGWFLLLVAGCFFISPVRSQFGFFGPLLPPATIYNISTSTVSLTVGTICYVPAMANITECRRKRGIEEQPYVVDGITGEIAPSQVLAIQATALPFSHLPGISRRSLNEENEVAPVSFPELLLRSSQLTEDEDDINQIQGRTVMNNFLNRLAADPREINMFNSIVVSSSCAGEPLNFSELLTCIGVTVQQTTTLTATLTITSTTTSGFTEIIVGGCTPLNFPYPLCTPLLSSGSMSSSSVAPTSVASSSVVSSTSVVGR